MKTYGKTILMSAALAALMFAGCKPTEGNYRKAYDAALAKREQAAAELMRPATGLLSDDGPELRVVEGDTLFVAKERLRLPGGERPSGKWAVAVALFKMNTNARASAEALHELGYGEACEANGAEGHHYTLLRTVETLDSARTVIRDFRRDNPGYPFIGLPGAPVIISF